MAEDTGVLPGLPAVGGKPVHIGFDGGRLTSDGGILLLAAIEGRLKIAERLADSRCFLPMHIYEAASGKPVAVILRPGKTRTGPRWRWCCAMSSAISAPVGPRSRSSCAATAITGGPRRWRGASARGSATFSNI